MTRQGWNAADRTLLFAAAVFLFALCLHLAYPASRLADGFLFVSEAALVGGIADWFAVTALFRKPLGFPCHTAILPRRRQAFVRATVTMVQKEFFSRRKIFRHLGRLHLLPMLVEWLESPATREQLQQRLLHYTRDILLQQDAQEQARLLAGQVRSLLLHAPARRFLEDLAAWLRRSGRDREILGKLAAVARAYAERPETRHSLERALEAYGRERAQSPGALLMAGIAQLFNLVNFEEAAELMQRQLVAMIGELARDGSPLQQKVLALCYEKAAALGQEPQFCRLAGELREDLVAELPLEEAIARALEHVQAEFLAAERRAGAMGHLPAVRSRLLDVFATEYGRAVALLKEDTPLQKSVERFLYDLIARSALHAQSLVGTVVANVLDRLTDEQLNRLVYDKVEPDLLWIRMNGSIVGSAIGLLLFGLLQLL